MDQKYSFNVEDAVKSRFVNLQHRLIAVGGARVVNHNARWAKSRHASGHCGVDVGNQDTRAFGDKQSRNALAETVLTEIGKTRAVYQVHRVAAQAWRGRP